MEVLKSLPLYVFASALEFQKLFPELSVNEGSDEILNKLISIVINGKLYGSATVLGVGMLNFTVGLARFFAELQSRNIRPSCVVLAGVCGAFKESGLQVGDVVRVDSEVQGDLGAQDVDGSFIPWHQVIGGQAQVFQAAEVSNAPQFLQNLKPAAGLTVNCCTGTDSLAQSRRAQFGCDVESMEGAACFAVCNALDIPAYQVRSVSNFVGNRDKSSWKIDQALQNLRSALVC